MGAAKSFDWLAGRWARIRNSETPARFRPTGLPLGRPSRCRLAPSNPLKAKVDGWGRKPSHGWADPRQHRAKAAIPKANQQKKPAATINQVVANLKRGVSSVDLGDQEADENQQEGEKNRDKSKGQKYKAMKDQLPEHVGGSHWEGKLQEVVSKRV